MESPSSLATPTPGPVQLALAGVGEPSPLAPASAPLALEELEGRARQYVLDARAPTTLAAYDGDWRRFCAWCRERGQAPYPAPPEAVLLYLTELAERGRKVSTLRRARAAIAVAHRRAEGACPTKHPAVRDLMRGVGRDRQPPKRAPALSPEQLSAMLGTLPADLRGCRDRALLTLGFAGAFRRAALVSLLLEDVREVERGLEVAVRKDKRERGRVLPVAFAAVPERCAVAAVREWTARLGRDRGPLFVAIDRGGRPGTRALSPRTVDRVVKKAARAAGLTVEVSSHSLRAGFVTSAIRKGHPLDRIRVVSGHSEGSRAFAAYVRYAGLWDGYAGDGVL